MTIPYAMIDSGSDSSIVSENIAKHLGLKINRKKIHRLNGIANKSHSFDTINTVPVTISNGQDNNTILDEFSIVPGILLTVPRECDLLATPLSL